MCYHKLNKLNIYNQQEVCVLIILLGITKSPSVGVANIYSLKSLSLLTITIGQYDR